MPSLARTHMPATTSETTPLNGTSNYSGRDRHRSSVAEFFLSRKTTPGMDSEHKWVRWPASAFNVTKVTLLSNYVNILLIFVPIGIIAGASGWNPTAVFILNFFAIIPLAAVLSFATEEISVKLGQTLGGLLNATFGNAVELIVCGTSVSGVDVHSPRFPYLVFFSHPVGGLWLTGW